MTQNQNLPDQNTAMKFLRHILRVPSLKAIPAQQVAALRAPKPTPPVLRQFVTLDEGDILEAIWQIQQGQHESPFVSIRQVAAALNVTNEEREWFLGVLAGMFRARVLILAPLDRPQDLASYAVDWCVYDGCSVCHLISVNITPMPAPVFRVENGSAAVPPSPWPAAPDESTANPHMQQHRVTLLVMSAAEQLQNMGRKFHAEQNKAA